MKKLFGEIKYVFKCISELKIKKIDIYILVGLNLLFNLSTVLQPLFLGRVINGVTVKSVEQITNNIFVLLLLFLLRLVFLFLKNMKNIKIISAVEMNIKENTLDGIVRSDFKKISQSNSGKLINIIDKDAMTFSNTINILVGLFSDILSFLSTLLIMLMISPFLTAIVLLIFPILMLSYYYIGKKIKTQEYKLKIKYDDYMLFLTETFTNFKILKIFNVESNHIKKFKHLLFDCYKIGIRKIKIETIGEVCLQALLLFSQALILILGALLIFQGTFSIGMLVSFNSYSENFKISAMNISKLNNTFQLISVSLERIKDFFSESEYRVDSDHQNNNQIEDIEELSLENVSCKRNDNKIFSNLVCSFKKGRINLVRGPSGCGKSTLFNIISRIDSEVEGEIFINGVNINNISNVEFRSKVCLVPQETLLFSESIIDNLRMDNENITQKEIEEVCAKLNLTDFIGQLENGYNTILRNAGKKISGGQAQRLCIARSILKDCEIYIFDEVISSLDKENAKEVIKVINEIAKEKIVILSSHQSIETYSNEYYFESNTNKLIFKEDTNETLYV